MEADFSPRYFIALTERGRLAEDSQDDEGGSSGEEVKGEGPVRPERPGWKKTHS